MFYLAVIRRGYTDNRDLVLVSYRYVQPSTTSLVFVHTRMFHTPTQAYEKNEKKKKRI